jgi:hypothetical protein
MRRLYNGSANCYQISGGTLEPGATIDVQEEVFRSIGRLAGITEVKIPETGEKKPSGEKTESPKSRRKQWS